MPMVGCYEGPGRWRPGPHGRVTKCLESQQRRLDDVPRLLVFLTKPPGLSVRAWLMSSSARRSALQRSSRSAGARLAIPVPWSAVVADSCATLDWGRCLGCAGFGLRTPSDPPLAGSLIGPLLRPNRKAGIGSAMASAPHGPGMAPASHIARAGGPPGAAAGRPPRNAYWRR